MRHDHQNAPEGKIAGEALAPKDPDVSDMPLLQPKLNLKVSQKQILTPGLVQMVSLLALNKLEIKEMINAEMVENPVLEELDESVPTIDEVGAREERLDRESEPAEPVAELTKEEKDPFEEIDFGNYFSEYLDPGFRSRREMEEIDKPSFENFLSKPATLTDHLQWQLGAMTLSEEARAAAELVIGNLGEDGYLLASNEELLAMATGLAGEFAVPLFGQKELTTAITAVQRMDPVGCAARDLRGCLLPQIDDLAEKFEENGGEPGFDELLRDCRAIVDERLSLLQNKQHRDLARATGLTLERVEECFNFIKRLDPRPGLRYNLGETRLIEPDVAILKQGDEYLALMNDEDLPQLRLNLSYRRLMRKEEAEKEVRNYVKERYKSAMQLMKNIEQRKQTILKVCYAIIGRQREFLDHGIDHLRPMMIKDVAEEIGVHPSTVSRAVANKYVHTQQGVFELRYFFSESVQGPEGGETSLLILKRRVKKMIEEEDPARPLTDDVITHMLQTQGIKVTRRTVAKYREDMHIPSTHQRRVRP